MITKNNLLEMLGKSVANEDEFILRYGKEFLRRVDDDQAFSDEEKKDIKELTQSILKDTQRHKEVLSNLIERIKGDKRNEF